MPAGYSLGPRQVFSGSRSHCEGERADSAIHGTGPHKGAVLLRLGIAQPTLNQRTQPIAFTRRQNDGPHFVVFVHIANAFSFEWLLQAIAD